MSVVMAATIAAKVSPAGNARFTVAIGASSCICFLAANDSHTPVRS